jgi:hypothetical protein
MVMYCWAVHLLKDKFDGLELNHIVRWLNEAADELMKLASNRALVPSSVFTSDLHKPSITCQDSAQDGDEPPTPTSGAGPTAVPTQPEVMEIVEDPAVGPDPLPDWRILYLNYLIHGALPANRTEALRLMRRAKSFILVDRELYKQSPTEILQRCIPTGQGRELLQDIHRGVCGHHASPRTLVENTF